MDGDRQCTIADHKGVKLVVNPAGSKHYGKWVCGECGKYISHAKMPKTSDEMVKRQSMIRQMLYKYPELSNDGDLDDELHKLLSLYSVGTMNMVQKERWAEFCSKWDPLDK